MLILGSAALPQVCGAQQDQRLLQQPLTESTNLIFVTCFVWSEELTFLVDSGSTGHILDSRYRPRLGESIGRATAETPDKDVEAEVYALPPLHTSEAPLRLTWPVAVMDLSQLSQRVGTTIDGVLGVELFRRYVIDVDLRERTVAILHEVPFLFPLRMSEIVVRLDDDFHGYVSAGGLGDEAVELMLDTGSNSILGLEPKAFDELINRQRIVRRGQTRLLSVSGESVAEKGILDQFAIGDLKYTTVSVHRSKTSAIGVECFANRRVIFDLGHARLLVLP